MKRHHYASFWTRRLPDFPFKFITYTLYGYNQARDMGQQGLFWQNFHIRTKETPSQKRIRTIKHLNCFYLIFVSFHLIFFISVPYIFFVTKDFPSYSVNVHHRRQHTREHEHHWTTNTHIHKRIASSHIYASNSRDRGKSVSIKEINTKKHQLRGKMMSWFTSFSVKFKTQDNSYPLFVSYISHFIYILPECGAVSCHATSESIQK